MCQDNLEDNWYALFVGTGQEEKIKEKLIYKFEDSLRFVIPKRKLKQRRAGKWFFIEKNLFPGYILINGQINVEDYYSFKEVPGIFKLLKSEEGPIVIPQEEIEFFLRFSCSKDIIDISDAFIEGDIINVVDGPLVGMEGNIIKVDKRKGRAKVSLCFLGEERTIDFGINILRKTN